MKNKRTTVTDTAFGPASSRSVSGGNTSRRRVVAWSLGPDPTLEADAKAWASRNRAELVSVIFEEQVWAQGRNVWSRAVMGELERAGITHILTRSGKAEHPNIETFAADLQRDGIAFASLDSSLTTQSAMPNQPLRPCTHLSVAQRLLEGRKAGAREGLHQSGPAPYGYCRNYYWRGKGEPLLEIHPEEAEVVRMIFSQYLRRKSMRKTIAFINDLGIKTRRRKLWSRAGIAWILKNETYLGRVHFGDIHVKGKHPAIISPIIFNKAQALIRKNNKRGGKDD